MIPVSLVATVAVLAALTLFVLDGTGAGWRPRPGGGDPVVPAGARLAPTSYPVPDGGVFVATSGSDSASGTSRQPLRTLAAAIRKVSSGGTVVLRAGTYRETVGMVRKQVTIQPYPGEQVWLKGSLLVTDWEPSGGHWVHRGWSPELCRDCYLDEIIDHRYPLAGLPDMVFVDGRPLRQVASRDELAGGTFLADPDAGELRIGTDPAGRDVEATAFPWLLQFDSERAAGSVLRGIGVAHYGSVQEYGIRGAMVVVNAPEVTIEHATFAWSASSGLAVFQPGGTVRDSTLANNGLVGLVANRAHHLRLTRNTFTGNNQERFALSGPAIGAAGAKLTRVRNAHVADNVFTGNLATGWWCDLGCTDATVIRNVASDNTGHGLYYEVSARALIASNLVTGNRGRGLKIASADHVRVYHNTFAANRTELGVYNDPRSPDFDGYSVEQGLSWVTSDTVLVNNLFAPATTGRPVVDSADHKPAPGGNPPFVSQADANAYLFAEPARPDEPDEAPLLVWSTGGGRVARFATLAELRGATGFERHGLQEVVAGSPFTDPDGGDYRLRPGTPGAGAALPLPPDVAAVLGLPTTPGDRLDIGLISGPRQR